MKSLDRCKWFRKYKNHKNHPAQFRRERWINRVLFVDFDDYRMLVDAVSNPTSPNALMMGAIERLKELSISYSI